jgi:predicted nucleic acid-binding protein
MATFDLDRTLRWLKPAKRLGALARRADDLLPWVSEDVVAGGELLLDTCIYIDELQGRAPDPVTTLLRIRTLNHSTVALAEMMHLFGRLDPADARTEPTLTAIAGLIRRIPSHRLHEADADIMAGAGALAGILCRLNGYQNDRKQKALHDCIIFLQARRLGFTVLTRNIADFDIITQMVPDGRVLFYRKV